MDDILFRSATYYNQQYLPQSFIHYNQHHDQYIAAAAASYNKQIFNKYDEDTNEIERRKSEHQILLNSSSGKYLI
jgi:hypothetical protein